MFEVFSIKYENLRVRLSIELSTKCRPIFECAYFHIHKLCGHWCMKVAHVIGAPSARAGTISTFEFRDFADVTCKQDKWLTEKLREEIYEFRWRGKIINEKYMKEEACKSVLVVDAALVPMHPIPFPLTTDPARWCGTDRVTLQMNPGQANRSQGLFAPKTFFCITL